MLECIPQDKLPGVGSWMMDLGGWPWLKGLTDCDRDEAISPVLLIRSFNQITVPAGQ